MDWDKLADFQGSCQKFDEVQIKGKGMMTTYIATPFQDTSLPDPRASQSGSTPPGSSVGAMVVPRSSAELLEFFIQNYSKDEFCGVFQPLWATMSRVDAPFPSNVPRRYERSVPWREGGGWWAHTGGGNALAFIPPRLRPGDAIPVEYQRRAKLHSAMASATRVANTRPAQPHTRRFCVTTSQSLRWRDVRGCSVRTLRGCLSLSFSHLSLSLSLALTPLSPLSRSHRSLVLSPLSPLSLSHPSLILSPLSPLSLTPPRQLA
jgi:hypothetical protein